MLSIYIWINVRFYVARAGCAVGAEVPSAVPCGYASWSELIRDVRPRYTERQEKADAYNEV